MYDIFATFLNGSSYFEGSRLLHHCIHVLSDNLQTRLLRLIFDFADARPTSAYHARVN